MLRFTPLLLSFNLLLVGCATHQEVAAPNINLPQNFSTHGVADQNPQWWKSFNDPQLNQLIELALNQNFSFQAAVDRLRQAKAQSIQVGAVNSPTIDATAKASRDYASSTTSNSFQVGLMASYELDLWSRLEATEQAAQFSFMASQQELDTVAITLTAEVATRWFELVALRQQIDLYQQQIENLNQQLSMLELHHQYGQSNIEDLWQQQQLVESQVAKKLALEAQFTNTEKQLALLVGGAQSEVVVFPELTSLPPMPFSGVPADLMTHRPDIKQAWLNVQQQNQNVIVAKAEQLPQIKLTASLLSGSVNLSELMEDWVTTLAGELIVPLVDGGAREAQVEEQKAALDEALNNYAQQVLIAAMDVEIGLTQEQTEQQQLSSIEQQLALASKTAQIKKIRYQNGSVEFLQVLTAQQSLLNLQQQQVESQGNLFALRIQLQRSLAGNLNTFESINSSAEMTPQTLNNTGKP